MGCNPVGLRGSWLVVRLISKSTTLRILCAQAGEVVPKIQGIERDYTMIPSSTLKASLFIFVFLSLLFVSARYKT